MNAAREHPHVLVLGAGGILGEAWMGGVLAGLEETSGFDARGCDHFVGTSAGSIVAAALAGGINPRDRFDSIPVQPGEAGDSPSGEPDSLFAAALRFGRGAGAAAVAPVAGAALRSTALGGAAVRRAALSRVPRGRRSLAQVGQWIDGLGVGWDGRLRVATVELESGRRIVFGEPGADDLSVGAAVQASCAIPGVFRPIAHRGRSYVDGGAWSLTNLDVAPVRRGTRVLCLNPTAGGAVGPLSRSVAAIEALALRRHGAHVTTLAPDSGAARAMGNNLMDGSRRSATQQAGYAQGLRAGASLAAVA